MTPEEVRALSDEARAAGRAVIQWWQGLDGPSRNNIQPKQAFVDGFVAGRGRKEMEHKHAHRRLKWDSGTLDRFCTCGDAFWVGPDEDGEWFARAAQHQEER